MKDTTKATWIARVEEWKRSGKTAAEFAEGQPFSGGTLTWRACQLRREASGGGRRRTVGRKLRPPRIVMAKVVRRARAPRDGNVTLEIGGVRISVSAGFDRALLREVVLALQEGRP